MATYISLIRYTAQGISGIKGSPDRVDDARKLYAQFGSTLKEFYLAMGEYDIIIISEAPDDETIAKIMLFIGNKGNVTTKTMRVFAEAEFRDIIKALPG
jgi:uncharacterized protein with GYD domain